MSLTPSTDRVSEPGAASPQANGAAAHTSPTETPSAASAEPAAAGESSSPQVQRAEEMVDRLAANAGQFAQKAKRQLSWFFGRVKEEAEDFWAEAQSIRRGKQQ
jgi:hypothetical protein